MQDSLTDTTAIGEKIEKLDMEIEAVNGLIVGALQKTLQWHSIRTIITIGTKSREAIMQFHGFLLCRKLLQNAVMTK